MSIHTLTFNNLEQFISKHLPIKQKEKNKYGEVFTPTEFIHIIYQQFPPQIFTNPKLKWLDPTAGVGNFMIILYILLMTGLNKWEPNKTKRSKHIISNMIYLNELNPNNCKIAKKLFGHNANINCGDFLTSNNLFNNITFDCIIGNPPFQHDYGMSNGRNILGGKNKLYEKIFLKSYELLTSDGYLSFIVPDRMFGGNGTKAYQTLLLASVKFISFNPKNQSYFPNIQQYICYFLLQKSKSTSQTTIESRNGTFQTHLTNRPVNPIIDWTQHTDELTNKYIGNVRNISIYNRGDSLASYKGTKYPIIYTPLKTLFTNDISKAIGFGIKKAIIFAISTKLTIKMDFKGEYGVGPNTVYIPFVSSNQGKQLEELLNKNDVKMLALITKTSRQYLKLAFIEYLKLPTTSTHTRTKRHSNAKTRKHKRN